MGQTPIIECDVKNKSFVSISGVISSDGYSYFEVRESEGFKQKGLTRFIDNIVADSRDKILMVWDGAPSHTSTTVKSYLNAQNKDNPIVWLAQLPPYSPELNPIEQVWGILKKRLANKFIKTTAELKKAVTDTLNEMKQDVQLIKSFFKNKDLICYQFSI